MSSTAPVFDPEVERLLREVAADPRSTLLRAPRPRKPLTWSDCHEPMSIATAGLTAAERQLLRVHRAEARTLLLRRAARLLERGGRVHLVGENTLEGESRALHRRDVLSAARRSSARAASAGTRPRAQQLVLIALRMFPSDLARLYLSAVHVLAERRDEARRLLGGLLGDELEPASRAAAWELVGVLEALSRHHGRASVAYAHACAVGEPRHLAGANALVFAMQAGDLAAAVRAAHLLDEWVDPESVVLSRYCEEQAASIGQGTWRPAASALVLWSRVSRESGAAANRVLEVLCGS